MKVTDHAVERFGARILGTASAGYDADRTLLESLLDMAVPLKHKTPKGESLMRLDDPPCVLVVKHDRKLREAFVVTVLEPSKYQG